MARPKDDPRCLSTDEATPKRGARTPAFQPDADDGTPVPTATPATAPAHGGAKPAPRTVWIRPTPGKNGRISLRSTTGRAAFGVDDYVLDLWTAGELSRREVLIRLELSPRLIRLFAVAICREIWGFLSDERSRVAVEVAERFADGRATVRERRIAHKAASDAYFDLCALYGHARSHASVLSSLAANAPRHAVDKHVDASVVASDAAALAVDATALAAGGRGEVDPVGERRIRERQGRLLAAIVGPGCELLSQWHTSTAVALARNCYETRDWSILPYLADALQDTGCEDRRVLEHCRGLGPHVRGDWVVDALLGLN